MEVGTGGFTNSSPAQGPVAGIDTKLFKGEDDLLGSRLSNPWTIRSSQVEIF